MILSIYVDKFKLGEGDISQEEDYQNRFEIS